MVIYLILYISLYSHCNLLTHQLLAYADDVNIVGKNADTIRKNTGLLDASKEVGPEVNPEKTKYMLMSRNQKI
jgi:hypothetical protein